MNMTIDKRKFWICIVFILLAALYISLSTNFSYFSNDLYGHDAGIFAGIGHAMSEGRILYTEIWENKGPLLYFINLLGISLNYYHGIYWLELLSIFITLLYCFKSALYITKNNWISLLAVLFTSLIYIFTLEGGNLSEEYALPFLSIGLYLTVKLIYNNFNLGNLEYILYGICIGATFLLRANLTSFYIVVIIVLTIYILKQRSFKLFFKILIMAFIGFVIIISPFLIYLITNNALEECLNTAYVGIMSNFEPPEISFRMKSVFDMLATLALSGSVFSTVITYIAFIVFKVKKRFINPKISILLTITIFAFILNFILNSLTGVYHMHYYMSFLPIMIIPNTCFINEVYLKLKRTINDRLKRYIVTVALVLLLSMSALPKFFSIVTSNLPNEDISKRSNRISEFVTENSKTDETVQLIGVGKDPTAVTTNYKAKRLSASRHIYNAEGRFTQAFRNDVANEIAGDILNNNPKLVMFSIDPKNSYDDFIKRLRDMEEFKQFLRDNYMEIQNNFGYLVFEKKI